MEESGQRSVADHRAIEAVGVGCSKVLGKPFDSLAVARIIVRQLAESTIHGGDGKRHWIDSTSKRQGEFLFDRKRDSILIVSGVELGNEPEHALVLLLSDFLL